VFERDAYTTIPGYNRIKNATIRSRRGSDKALRGRRGIDRIHRECDANCQNDKQQKNKNKIGAGFHRRGLYQD
jgi:hypothetical protein